MSDYIIETNNLSKVYKLEEHKDIIALKNVSLKIKNGETFGLLGPNGAGKTTFVNILTTLIHPTEGYAYIEGIDILKKPKKVRKRIGLMAGASMIYFRITGYQNLKFFAKIYDVKNYHEKIIDIAKRFELEKWLDQYPAGYSLGMKTKLALCRALIIDTPILFLDEPTLGLDVTSRALVIKIINELNKTICLTSHNMNVVEKVCDRIAFINKGEIIKSGTQSQLKDTMKSETIILIDIIKDKDRLKKELNQQDFVNKTKDSNQGLIISIKDKKFYRDLFLILSKYDVNRMQEQDISLDDLFISLNT